MHHIVSSILARGGLSISLVLQGEQARRETVKGGETNQFQVFPEDYNCTELWKTFNSGATRILCLKLFWCNMDKTYKMKRSRLYISLNIYFFLKCSSKSAQCIFKPTHCNLVTKASRRFHDVVFFFPFVMCSVCLKCPKR